MTHNEVRNKFIKYFESKGHAVVASSSLLPDDPSVLFTTAGMQQFKPYYTGAADAKKDFNSLNTVSIQKSMRTSDIDEVGDESHLTFFEMMGNFSFGGYWKKEAIQYAYEFITKELGLTISHVSVFGGNDAVPRDNESAEIWKSIDSNLKVVDGDINDNFWGPTGSEGPCGPTTEVYIDDLEVWNIVFNEFFYPGSREELLSGKSDKQLTPLKIQGIDTGMGLERLSMVINKKDNIYETDLFEPLITLLPANGDVSEKVKRIISDHSRAAAFLICDGVRPSNKEQGYVLRRLMRRIIVHLHTSGIEPQAVDDIFDQIVLDYGSFYPELEGKLIKEEFNKEKEKFEKTLSSGLKELERLDNVNAASAFKLYESFGLPFEIIREIGKEKASGLTRESFEGELEKHREISRAGAEKKFGGHGIVIKEGDLTAENDEEMKIKTRLHTATHVLFAALKKVLGSDLKQAGSDINVERLRFDFTFPRKMTPEEIREVEDIANKAVEDDLPVTWKEMDLDEAIKSGASAFFKLKYPPRVKVYTIGNDSNWFSRELCGGPHVSHTGEIGKIKIIKEESVSGGARRIKAAIS